MKGILGKKIGMSHVFGQGGEVIPVTLVEAGPCYVTQIKTTETDGYTAVQIGFGDAKDKHINKPEMGHLKKAGVHGLRYLHELRAEEEVSVKLGQEVKADVFNEGDLVDVTGISRGKGFQGVIKRWGFHRRPMSHGHHNHRAPGSIGMAASPSRVLKGKKLPGRMGAQQRTVCSLEVVRVENKMNLIAVKGNVPGPKGGFVVIKEAKRSQSK